MQPFASGAAFVDRSGAVVVADPGFVSRLGLAEGDPTGALRTRAETSPELRALLAGDGPTLGHVPGAGGAPVEIERISCGEGALLLVRSDDAHEWVEHAMRSQGLGRLAGGVAHDIKNPLNAMSLQLALLGEKLSGSADASGTAATHLSALRDQIGRVNEILRRFVDVADPSAPLGYTDLGALVADLSSLFTHESRRRRIELVAEAQRGVVRTACEPTRVGRLVLGLFARALAETPDGGRLVARTEARPNEAVLLIEHVSDDPGPALGYYTDAAAASARALGGAFGYERQGGVVRLSLSLPRNDRE